jgi:hypothetical protein
MGCFSIFHSLKFLLLPPPIVFLRHSFSIKFSASNAHIVMIYTTGWCKWASTLKLSYLSLSLSPIFPLFGKACPLLLYLCFLTYPRGGIAPMPSILRILLCVFTPRYPYLHFFYRKHHNRPILDFYTYIFKTLDFKIPEGPRHDLCILLCPWDISLAC